MPLGPRDPQSRESSQAPDLGHATGCSWSHTRVPEAVVGGSKGAGPRAWTPSLPRSETRRGFWADLPSQNRPTRPRSLDTPPRAAGARPGLPARLALGFPWVPPTELPAAPAVAPLPQAPVPTGLPSRHLSLSICPHHCGHFAGPPSPHPALPVTLLLGLPGRKGQPSPRATGPRGHSKPHCPPRPGRPARRLCRRRRCQAWVLCPEPPPPSPSKTPHPPTPPTWHSPPSHLYPKPELSCPLPAGALSPSQLLPMPSPDRGQHRILGSGQGAAPPPETSLLPRYPRPEADPALPRPGAKAREAHPREVVAGPWPGLRLET